MARKPIVSNNCVSKYNRNSLIKIIVNTFDFVLVDQFDNYCKEIAETAAWGGQLEVNCYLFYLVKYLRYFLKIFLSNTSKMVAFLLFLFD